MITSSPACLAGRYSASASPSPAGHPARPARRPVERQASNSVGGKGDTFGASTPHDRPRRRAESRPGRSWRRSPARLHEGRTVTLPHRILVHAENPYRDNTRQCRVTAPPSSKPTVAARRLRIVVLVVARAILVLGEGVVGRRALLVVLRVADASGAALELEVVPGVIPPGRSAKAKGGGRCATAISSHAQF